MILFLGMAFFRIFFYNVLLFITIRFRNDQASSIVEIIDGEFRFAGTPTILEHLQQQQLVSFISFDPLRNTFLMFSWISFSVCLKVARIIWELQQYWWVFGKIDIWWKWQFSDWRVKDSGDAQFTVCESYFLFRSQSEHRKLFDFAGDSKRLRFV